jgi:hypothetical protein
MKSKGYLLTVLLVVLCSVSNAQIQNSPAFGIKGGFHHMETILVKQPKNYLPNLIGIRGAYGFQGGVWGTVPLNRWLFVEVDLDFSEKGYQRYIPRTDTVVANSRYRYLGVNPQLGITYKGFFLTAGPEVNFLVSKSVLPPTERVPVVAGLTTRLGYQYHKLRAEVFYSRGLTMYDRNTWDEIQKIRTLFYGRSVGLSVGVQLAGGKRK